MNTTRFNKSDSWIFLSIGSSNEGSPFDSIIAKADWINHAIPNEDEFEDALNHLLRAGLISITDEKVHLTDTGREIYAHATSQGRAILKIWDKLDDYWNRLELPTLEVEPFRLQPGRFQAAFKVYENRFSDKLKNRSER